MGRHSRLVARLLAGGGRVGRRLLGVLGGDGAPHVEFVAGTDLLGHGNGEVFTLDVNNVQQIPLAN